MTRFPPYAAGRDGQGFLYCPAESQSLLDATDGYALRLAPVVKRLRDAVHGGASGASGIPKLLSPCGPSTVVGFVVAVIVDAVDGVFGRRTLTHVGVEVVEVVPAFAHLDAAASMVRPEVAVSTTSDHALPNLVFGGADLSRQFTFDAPAVLCGPVPQPVRWGGNLDTAIASTQPYDAPAPAFWSWTQYRQLAESLTRQVVRQVVECYSAISHAGSSHTGIRVVRGRWSLPTIIGSVPNYPTFAAVSV